MDADGAHVMQLKSKLAMHRRREQRPCRRFLPKYEGEAKRRDVGVSEPNRQGPAPQPLNCYLDNLNDRFVRSVR